MKADKKGIVQREIDAWNNHDAEALVACYTDDCIYESIAVGSQTHGKENLKKGLVEAFKMYPDQEYTVLSLFEAEDIVVSEWSLETTQKFKPDGTPNDKKLKTRGVNLLWFRGEKICKSARA
jgi:steroid delta-isomerase-like uncharacterized protein